jgi:2-polyprenyl-3-methyl-5-hydroxy-6-metoxy-1,4-benzoquinol methylase
MRKYAHLATPGNRRFFQALAGHLGHAVDHPCLSMYMEFALSTNERGRKVAQIIDAMLPLAGKRSLDVGCAYGGFLVAFAERGADPSGFDIAPDLLALAAQNFADHGCGFPVRLADVTKAEDVASFARSFDVITCNDVIEHVDDPDVTIGHVAAMLRPGGLAYFEIPNRDAAAFVACDGHYQLYGITQLDREDATRYFAAHSPGVPYGVAHYLRLPEYRALFAAHGLAVDVLPGEDGADPGSVAAQLDDLAANLAAKLEGVPAEVRDDVRAAVQRYLDEAARSPRATPAERNTYVQRYGTSFWRVVARKPPPSGSDSHLRANAPEVRV